MFVSGIITAIVLRNDSKATANMNWLSWKEYYSEPSLLIAVCVR